MMATYCDRCGVKFKKLSFVHGEKELKLQRYMPDTGEYFSSFKVVDLCPACQKSLEEWLREGLQNEKR